MSFSISNGSEYITFDVVRYYEELYEPLACYALRIHGAVDFLQFDQECFAFAKALQELYSQMQNAYQTLSGTVCMDSFHYDSNFSLQMKFDKTGNVLVHASMRGICASNTACDMEFTTDQTFVQKTLRDMKETLGF